MRAVLSGQARRYSRRTKPADATLAVNYKSAASGVPPTDTTFAYHVLVVLKDVDGAWHLDEVASHFGVTPEAYASLAGTTPEALR